MFIDVKFIIYSAIFWANYWKIHISIKSQNLRREKEWLSLLLIIVIINYWRYYVIVFETINSIFRGNINWNNIFALISETKNIIVVARIYCFAPVNFRRTIFDFACSGMRIPIHCRYCIRWRISRMHTRHCTYTVPRLITTTLLANESIRKGAIPYSVVPRNFQ